MKASSGWLIIFIIAKLAFLPTFNFHTQFKKFYFQTKIFFFHLVFFTFLWEDIFSFSPLVHLGLPVSSQQIEMFCLKASQMIFKHGKCDCMWAEWWQTTPKTFSRFCFWQQELNFGLDECESRALSVSQPCRKNNTSVFGPIDEIFCFCCCNSSMRGKMWKIQGDYESIKVSLLRYFTTLRPMRAFCF